MAHPGLSKRRYSVKGLTDEPASECYFHNEEEDSNMSVAQYYEHKYKVRAVLFSL